MEREEMLKLPPSEEIIEALDLGYSSRLEEGTLEFSERIYVAPQIKKGVSEWARLLRAGVISPWDVMWAFCPDKKGNPVIWLAARVQIKEDSHYFNLRNRSDRIAMKDLISLLDIAEEIAGSSTARITYDQGEVDEF